MKNKGEIATIITLITFIVIGVTSFVSSVFIANNKNKQVTQSKAFMNEEANLYPDDFYPADYSTKLTTSPEIQPNAPSTKENSASCECIDGVYQGEGCVGGQIGEKCSSFENLSCFNQCLTETDKSVEECNNYCNDLEKNELLLTVTPVEETCFPEGTLITMADDTQKEIQFIREGDIVKSYNILTKTFSNEEVEKLFVHPNVPGGYYVINNNLSSTPFFKNTF